MQLFFKVDGNDVLTTFGEFFLRLNFSRDFFRQVTSSLKNISDEKIYVEKKIEGKIIFSKILKTYSESIPHVPPDDFFENVISTIGLNLDISL